MRAMKLFPLLLAALLAAVTAHAAPETHWRDQAASELDAARDAVRAGHPGAIDKDNPAFGQWDAKGYEQARAMLPMVDSYDSMLAVVRYYLAGFQDGSLTYLDDVRKAGDQVSVAGWRLDYANGTYRVGAVLSGWAKPLPPVGARLLSCDGQAPDQRLRQRARYFDGRDLPGVRHGLAAAFTRLDMRGDALKQCTFRTAKGEVLALAQHYSAVTAQEGWAMPPTAPVPAPFGYTLRDGLLWIRVSDFREGSQTAEKKEALLEEMRELKDVRAIVFDTRGSAGEDLQFAYSVYTAVTGGLSYDASGAPREYGEWRASDIAVKEMERRIALAKAAEGPDSRQADWLDTFRNQFLMAQKDGRHWIEQDGGLKLSRADFVFMQARLRRFSGKLALVTDENCATTCRDFAEGVRRVPALVHMGQATSASSSYTEAAYVSLPSGNRLQLPMKVMRERPPEHGHNRVLAPDVPLRVDMRNDAAVRKAVLAALPR